MKRKLNNKSTKAILYEKIMKDVASIVKKHLNEDGYTMYQNDDSPFGYEEASDFKDAIVKAIKLRYKGKSRCMDDSYEDYYKMVCYIDGNVIDIIIDDENNYYEVQLRSRRPMNANIVDWVIKMVANIANEYGYDETLF